MQETKPAWRQREADCRKIGSALYNLCSVEDAETLKQYFEIADFDLELERENVRWTEYSIESDLDTTNVDRYEYALEELRHYKLVTEIHHKKQRKLVEIQHMYPELFGDAVVALRNIADHIEYYMNTLAKENN